MRPAESKHLLQFSLLLQRSVEQILFVAFGESTELVDDKVSVRPVAWAFAASVLSDRFDQISGPPVMQ